MTVNIDLHSDEENVVLFKKNIFGNKKYVMEVKLNKFIFTKDVNEAKRFTPFMAEILLFKELSNFQPELVE